MFSVALIGLDGAGKSTVGRRVEEMFPRRVKYIYMGINLDSSNLVLPTTRLLLELKRLRGKRPVMAGPSGSNRTNAPPKGIAKRMALGAKSALRVLTLLGEEALRLSVAWYYERLGYIVLFDRHFYFDYYTSDIAAGDYERSISSRLHGFMLEHLFPKPDLTIFLDAPAELLLARKGEGTLEWLEQRRQEYMKFRNLVKHFVILDASQPLEVVTQETANSIFNYCKSQGTSISHRTIAGHP